MATPLRPPASVAAGLLVVRETDGKALLVRRAPGQTRPGHWSPPGGSLEGDETPFEAAVREAGEELGPLPGLDFLRDEGYWSARGPFFAFGTFLAILPGEHQAWEPDLNPENDAWGWFSPDVLPSPLLPGVGSAVRDLVRRSWRWGPPRMGIEAAIRSYSSCKVVNLDEASPFFLTMALTVIDEATGNASILTVPFHERVPQLVWAPICVRTNLERAKAHYEAVLAQDPALRLSCAEGLEWETVFRFALLEAAQNGAQGLPDLEEALALAVGRCVGR